MSYLYYSNGIYQLLEKYQVWLPGDPKRRQLAEQVMVDFGVQAFDA